MFFVWCERATSARHLSMQGIGEVEKEEAYVKAKEIKSRPERASAQKAKANMSKSMYTEVINLD